MRSARASASDVSWFGREVQDFLAAGASFSRRPYGLKNMRFWGTLDYLIV